MEIERLDAGSAINPFLLTLLPLDTLDIDFGETLCPAEDWLHQSQKYHMLVSAMLYQAIPKASDGSIVPLHQSLVARTRRSIATTLLQQWPTKKQLYRFLLNMNTKKLSLRCTDADQGLL